MRVSKLSRCIFVLIISLGGIGIPSLVHAAVTNCGSGECLPHGCSNTSQSIQGYLDESEIDLFRNIDMGGGSIGAWAGTDPHPGTPDKHAALWGKFDAELAAGYEGVFMEICPSGIGDGLDRVEDDLIVVINMLVGRGVSPSQIWVSGLQFYPPGHVCVRTKAEGPQVSNDAADFAVLSHGVNRGPILSLSQMSELGPDGCHLSEEGQATIGRQIEAFFDTDTGDPPTVFSDGFGSGNTLAWSSTSP